MRGRYLPKFSFFKRTYVKLRNRNYNFYEVLGVEKSSTNEEIKSAYLKMAKQYHPDINKDEGAEEKFKSITSAYEALNNQRNRDLYDAYMYSDPYTDNNYNYESAGKNDDDNFYKEKAKWDKFSENFRNKQESSFWGKKNNAEAYEEDVFKDFENIFNSGYQTKKAKGEDILVEIKITFEESFNGVIKGIKIQNKREVCSSCKGTKSTPGFRPSKCFSCSGTGEARNSILGGSKCKICKGQGYIIKNPCKTCKGTGINEKETTEALNIPSGIKSETILKADSKGHCSDNMKNPNGDLFVKVIVEDSKVFKRRNDDLIFEVEINLRDAIFGATKEIPILFNNRKHILTITPQTQPNHEIIISGCGFTKQIDELSNKISLIRGDQINVIKIKIPNLDNLNKAEREEFTKLINKI